MWKMLLVAFSALFAFGAGAQIAGGFTTIDMSDSGAQNALDYAVVRHNKGSNDMYVYKPTEVLTVQRQVVAGYKYVITVRMERTSCKKGDANETCDVLTRDSPLARNSECTFTVWVQPWNDFMQLTKQTCKTSEEHVDPAV